MFANQNPVTAYVEQRLANLGITKAEACARCGIPEDLIDRFLVNANALAYWELLRVILAFGSVLGDPTELARACGIPISWEE